MRAVDNPNVLRMEALQEFEQATKRIGILKQFWIPF